MAAASCLSLACTDDDDYRRSLTKFETGVGTVGDPERSFRGAMSSFHMSDQDIDCMVRQAFASPPARTDGGYVWTADDLNTFAAECRVDFSDLWYSAD